MATSARELLGSPLDRLGQLDSRQKMLAMIAGAAIIAAIIGSLFFSRSPDYKVLFSNLDPRDGGQIIDALQKMNVPYKVGDGDGTILVPADKVHEMRLKLGAQGLPKGSGVGFELLDKERIGTSQFVEQVNYQRGLEGELAKSIESLAAVATARVHLALPKQSVFVRDQEKPSASVVLSLYNGRYLDSAQIAGIVHLVSSSIPNLSPDRVTIVDQSGKLLTRPDGGQGPDGLNPTQLEYVHKVERDYSKRVEDMLAPVLGPNGVNAKVSADIDFSQTERTSETYNPEKTAIRSEQRVNDQNVGAGGNFGIPGALSNQPPAVATAPFTAPTASASSAAPVAPTSSHSESTINYEIDKTISHTKEQVGVIKRLSVAVVVNNKPVAGKNGQIEYRPLQPAELAQINNLVRDAIGFNAQRGDSVNVVNMAFNNLEPAQAAVQWWKEPYVMDLAKYGIYLLFGLLIYLLLLRPVIKGLTRPASPGAAVPSLAGTPNTLDTLETHLAVPVDEVHDGRRTRRAGDKIEMAGETTPIITISQYDQDLATARQLVAGDPKKAAQVVKEWLNSDN